MIGLNGNGVKEILDPLVEVSASVGLKINESKTKYLVNGFSQGTESNFSSGHGRHSFEGVNQFKYLGSLITHDNNVRVMILKTV